jgi:tetratricopeptide (TPR) repeat protein/tRNA A-37 threonylcarbamoyl transferase component Bud32
MDPLTAPRENESAAHWAELAERIDGASDRSGELRADQIERWKRNEDLMAEDYIGRIPNLTNDDILVLLATEMSLRRDRGEAIDLAAFQNRFPSLAVELALRFLRLNELTQRQETPLDHSTIGSGAKSARSGDDAWPVIPRFEVTELIARGGMGAVYRARDGTLKREIAIKVIHDRYKDSPHARRRFEYEATITAQLQHPSIPPVHDLGTAVNGSPYLALKLIKGQTLDELLKSRPDVAHERGRYVAIFESISHAIGYAHSRGVLHRDLKPLNVMVGAFGEVQVMDWGLAKFRGDMTDLSAEATTASTFHDPRSAEETQTKAGSILGTPAYMPPEQAIGAIDQVDERSDVFGLGAILCTILTGRPPFVGRDAESTRQLAARGRMDDAWDRLDRCGADSELVALAKRCLAVEPDARPANGSAVAQEVASLRADADRRLREAEIARGAAEARRRVLARSAVAVVAVLTAGIAVSAWQAIRATDAERETALQLKKTQAAERTANAKTREVEDSLAVVEERTRLALDAYNQMVFEVQNKLENRPGTQELRRELLELARGGLATVLAEARKNWSTDQTLVWCHLKMGDVELGLGNLAAAHEEYRTAHELAQRWASADPTDMHSERDLCVCHEKLGRVALMQGRATEALPIFREVAAVFRRLARANPADALLQRDLGVAYEQLGDVLLRLSEIAEGREAYRKALEVYQGIADADPGSKPAQRDLSSVLLRLSDASLQSNDVNAAIEFNRTSLTLAQRLADADPRDVDAQNHLSWVVESLGMCFARLGRDRDAYDRHQQALAIRKRLSEIDSRNVVVQKDLAISWEHVGNAALNLDRPTEALESYREALAGRLRLAELDPDNADIQRDIGTSHERIGNVRLRLREWKDARASYQRYHAIARRLSEADPKSPDLERDYRWSLQKMGSVEHQAGEYPSAIRLYEQALDVAKRSERSRELLDEMGDLKRLIEDCRANRPPADRREVAPPPRAIGAKPRE